MIEPIVSSHWLQTNYVKASVCEVRPGGRDSWVGYLDGHLPGAAFVDLDAVLSGPPAPVAGRHPLPDPTQFAKSLGAMGIGDEATVVAYDDMGGAYASRLVWMLRVLGQPAAPYRRRWGRHRQPCARAVPRRDRTARQSSRPHPGSNQPPVR